MTKTPILRPISWLNTAITLGVLVACVVVGWVVNRTSGMLFGALAYVILSQLLRRIIARHHRNAIGHTKRQEFEEAIPEFKKSLAFFRHHDWVDKFRAITMFSTAGMSYREMAMVSLGFCYGQIGDGTNARNFYQQCLQEFPNNGMAQAALRLLDAGANSRDAG